MSGRDPEARVIYLLLVVLTLPVLVLVRLHHEAIGPGATICMVLCALGGFGLIVERRRSSDVPSARIASASDLQAMRTTRRRLSRAWRRARAGRSPSVPA